MRPVYARDKVELGRKLMAQWMGKLGFELEILADYQPADVDVSEIIVRPTAGPF